MNPHAACKVAVRLIGVLIVGVSFSGAWSAGHRMFFNRIWFGVDLAWLWPFGNYDAEAMDDLGKLIQGALGLGLIVFAGFVARLVMRGVPGPGRCPKCGYDVTGVRTGKCPECGEILGAAGPIH